ncbi:MAG TPA: hypothetical protein VM345_09660 [Acidimicrobiales bacterium]|nr:hypothetical protein [Acidimicrobiales bacterium]
MEKRWLVERVRALDVRRAPFARADPVTRVRPMRDGRDTREGLGPSGAPAGGVAAATGAAYAATGRAEAFVPHVSQYPSARIVPLHPGSEHDVPAEGASTAGASDDGGGPAGVAAREARLARRASRPVGAAFVPQVSQ